MEPGSGGGSGEAERDRLLEACVEAKRLGRARPLAAKVVAQVAEPDLVIAAVSSYNVLVDAAARRVLHGCRDFQGQAPQGKLCKHVAAVLLSLEPAAAAAILRGLADPDSGWRLEVVAPRFGG